MTVPLPVRNPKICLGTLPAFWRLAQLRLPEKGTREKLNTYPTHVAGTSVDILKSNKVPTDNTTGYKGVYWIRGKYVAKIVFQKD